MISSPFELYRFQRACVKIFEVLETMPDILEPTRRGFMMTLAEQLGLDDDGDFTLATIVHGEIGFCPPEKGLLYRYFSVRKLLRLLEYPNHLTSQQSADPEAESKAVADRDYGGGIRFFFQGNTYLFSISGLPWKCDEAFCVVVSWAMGWISDGQVTQYAAISKNNVTLKLLHAVQGKGITPPPGVTKE